MRKSHEFSFKIVRVITIIVSNPLIFLWMLGLWRQSIASGYSTTSRFFAILLLSPCTFLYSLYHGPDWSEGRTVTRLDRMCLCGLNPVPWSQGTQLPEVLFFIIFPDSDKILCNYVLIWEKIFVFLCFLYFLNHFLIMNRKREKLCTFERSQLEQFSTYIKFYFTNEFITPRELGEYTIF